MATSVQIRERLARSRAVDDRTCVVPQRVVDRDDRISRNGHDRAPVTRAREPAVLAHYAKHYKSGAPMPAELLRKVLAAQTFNQGYATTEYISAALLDQSWHQISESQAPSAENVSAFEAAALQQSGVDYPAVPPRAPSVTHKLRVPNCAISRDCSAAAV
ncbi:MAG: M3 family metallopeptidase [Gammaproteobacteria bacterium]|nr:MAG: M3 family metallopeptidase [Gammaproteobacteria bacterium]